MASPSELLMVHYNPVNNAGWEMWKAGNYNGAQYQADMQIAAGLGFNTVRVGVSAVSSAFDFPSPTDDELANLSDLYSRSKTAGVKLRLLLFDLFGGVYGQIANSQTWAQAVLGSLPDTDNIHSIEVHSELPLINTSAYSAGFDSGWPDGTPQYTQIGQVATVWTQQMIAYVRTLVSVPVTMSVTAEYNPVYDPLAIFTAATTSLTGSFLPDWFELHWYPNYPWPYSSSYFNTFDLPHTLAAAKALAGSAGLYIGEFGCDSAVTTQNAQADYIYRVRAACFQAGVPEPSPWQLFDVNSSSQFSGGQSMGLYTTAGAAKLSQNHYQSFPPGSPPKGQRGLWLQ